MLSISDWETERTHHTQWFLTTGKKKGAWENAAEKHMHDAFGQKDNALLSTEEETVWRAGTPAHE